MPRAIINGGPAASTASLKSAMKPPNSKGGGGYVTAEESVTTVQLRGKVKGLEANVSALEEQLVQKEARIKDLEAGLKENLAMLAELEQMDQQRSIKSSKEKKERKKEKKKEELMELQSKLKEETKEKEQLAMQLELAQKRTEDLEQHVQLQLQFLEAVKPKPGQEQQQQQPQPEDPKEEKKEEPSPQPVAGNLGLFVRDMEIVSNLLQEKIAAVKDGKQIAESGGGDNGAKVVAATAIASSKKQDEKTTPEEPTLEPIPEPENRSGNDSASQGLALASSAGNGAAAASGFAAFFRRRQQPAKEEPPKPEPPKPEEEEEEEEPKPPTAAGIPSKEEAPKTAASVPASSGPSTGVIAGAVAATGAAVAAGTALLTKKQKKVVKKKKKKKVFVPDGAPPAPPGKQYIEAVIPKTKGSKLGMKLTEAADAGEDHLVIANILPGGLADISKLEIGMFLYSVNGKPVKGKTAMEVAGMLAVSEGTVTVVALGEEKAGQDEEEEYEEESEEEEDLKVGIVPKGRLSRQSSQGSLASIKELSDSEDGSDADPLSSSDFDALREANNALVPSAPAAGPGGRRVTVATPASAAVQGARRQSFMTGMAKMRRATVKISAVRAITKAKCNRWASALRRMDPRFQILSYFDEVAKKGAQALAYCDAHSSPDGICTQGCLGSKVPGKNGTEPPELGRRSSYFASDEEAKTASSIFNQAGVFTVWRPTSLDSIRKMMVGDGVGKGLDIKGKSAKKGHFSGFVPFLQLHQDKHKTMTRTVPKDARMRIFYKTPEARTEAHLKLLQVTVEMLAGYTRAQKVILEIKKIEAEEEAAEKAKEADVDDFSESKTDAIARAAVLEERDARLQEALEKYMWEMEDPVIYLVDDYAPQVYGLDIPQRIVFEAYIIRGDCSRPPGSIHETGRGSEPAFQDMNMETLRNQKPGAPRPVCVLQSEDLENAMDPRYLLMAYEENGVVKPVVSDFDCFLVGTRRIDFDKPLPSEQVELMKWCISVIERILDIPPSTETWTMRWLEELKREYEKGFHVSFPKYGFADPTSYAVMAHAVSRLCGHGSVRHGAECFNYYFPQDLDDEFLVVTNNQVNGPWVKYGREGLLNFLSDKIDEGFMFPVNPKWALCDKGWKSLYDKQMSSDNEWTIKAMNAWYPPKSGVREMIASISSKHPGAFQVLAGDYHMDHKFYSPLRQASEDGEEVTGDQAMDMALLEVEHDRVLKKAIKAINAIMFANRMAKF